MTPTPFFHYVIKLEPAKGDHRSEYRARAEYRAKIATEVLKILLDHQVVGIRGVPQALHRLVGGEWRRMTDRQISIACNRHIDFLPFTPSWLAEAVRFAGYDWPTEEVDGVT